MSSWSDQPKSVETWCTLFKTMHEHSASGPHARVRTQRQKPPPSPPPLTHTPPHLPPPHTHTSGVDGATGGAWRRRERRLRSWWRHEAQSVSAAVATALHHSTGPASYSAPQGPEMATAGREGELYAQPHSPRGQKAPLPGKSLLAQPLWPQAFVAALWCPSTPGLALPSLAAPAS